MEIKILQVFYDKNGLPYKDKERTVHYPITSGTFLGASNTTQIRFYYDQLDELNESTFVAVSKLPNGKIGSEILESAYDEELNENYVTLSLSQFYTQYKGDVYISLQGYQGGVRVEQDENGIYQIYGTPTIQATGSIKLSIAYAPTFIGSGQTENVTLQRVLAELSTKLGIRQETLHVEELPTVGNPNVWYVVNDDPNDTTKANIYIWNATTQTYVWVGDNTLNLGDYYTKEQGEQFESDIGNRVTSVENELSSVASGSPKGVYSTLSDLETAYPTGTDGIYIVSATGHWYYWNGNAWADGGVYLSSENYEIASHEISDLENKYTRYNLFDKDSPNIIAGKYIAPSNGQLDTSALWSALIFEIDPSYTYLAYKKSSQVLGAFYDSSKTFISGFNSNSVSGNTLTIPNNAKYVGFSCATADLSVLRVWYGNEANPNYYPYSYVRLNEQNINIKASLVDELHLVDYYALRGKVDNQIIDQNKFNDGYYIYYVNGKIDVDASYSATDYIEVVYNAIYQTFGAISLMMAYYDKDYNFVSGQQFDRLSLLKVPNNPQIKYARFSLTTANKTNFKLKLIKDSINIGKKDISSLFGFKNENLINFFNDNYYCDYGNGKTAYLADYTTTDAIPVIPNAKYNFAGRAGGSQGQFFAEDGSFISGFATGSVSSINAPSNAAYMIWCSTIAEKTNMSITIERKIEQAPIVVNSGDSILQAAINANANGINKIIVEAGTYDIIDEYENMFGSSYFTNYQDNYNGQVHGKFDCGIWLENIEIVFSPGAKVLCNYTGNNEYVKTWFSAFATGNNVIINGLVMESSNTRFGIHADFNSGDDLTYFIVNNCELTHNRGEITQTLGCGLGKHVHWVFENCIFHSNGNYPILRIHNNYYDDAQSKIVVKNCYVDGEGYMLFNAYSTSELITEILVSNCSWINSARVSKETQDSYMNFHMYSWNNETRS